MVDERPRDLVGTFAHPLRPLVALVPLGRLPEKSGADRLRQLVAMVAARRSKSADAKLRYVIECMGVRPGNATTDEVLKWVNTRIALGDEVSFKFVEVAQAQDPIDRQNIPAHAPNDN